MNLIPLDEVIHFDAQTSTPSTSVAVDADSTPTYSLFEEDTDTPIVTGNFTKRTGLTGEYRGSITLSAANGCEVGKCYNLKAYATVGSAAGKCVVMRFRVAPAESSAGVPKGDVSHFGGTAGTFASGVPETKVASVAAGAITAAAIATDAIDADALATDAVTEIQSGLSTLNAAGIRTAVGLASANLDTQLGDLPTATEIADGIIARNIAGGSSTGRTVGHALAAIRNKSAITAIDETAGTATLTVYDTDDTSVLFTASISLTTLTKSITAMDPA